MLFLYGDQLSYWLVEDLTTWTTWEHGVDGRTWNHNRDICGTLGCGLLRNARLSISLEVRRMIQRFIGVLELGLGSVNLKRMTSEISLNYHYLGGVRYAAR